MNLDDQLNSLKEDVPEVNPTLHKTIYQKSERKKGPISKKVPLLVCSLVLITLIAIIVPVTYFARQQQINSSATLLKMVAEPDKASNAPTNYEEFSKQVNEFSAQLSYDYIQSISQNDNSVLSPISIFSALTLALECSDGETRNQLLEAMRIDYELLKENYPYLYQSLQRVISKDSQCKLTNSIWLDQNLKFKENCLSSLANDYYCYSHGVDFKRGGDASKYISNFISKKTNGLLKPTIDVTPETAFMLINTLYLKDLWNDAGDKLKLTDEEYTFTSFNQTKVGKKLLMGDYFEGKALETETYTQFYTKTSYGYKLYFVLPKQGHSIDDVFVPSTIASLNSSPYEIQNDTLKEAYLTRCLFPKFSVSSSLNLKEILTDKYGLTDMFDTQKANFNSLSDDSFFCNSVTHLAKLEVNERGVEGAATTIFPGATAPDPGEYKKVYYDFVVDQSFGFVITTSSGVNLFSGIIRSI